MNQPAEQPQSISHQAHGLARIVDQTCRAPGVYTVRVVIPEHRRAEWTIEVARAESLRVALLPSKR